MLSNADVLQVFLGAAVLRVPRSTGGISSVGVASTPEYQDPLNVRSSRLVLRARGILGPSVFRFDTLPPI